MKLVCECGMIMTAGVYVPDGMSPYCKYNCTPVVESRRLIHAGRYEIKISLEPPRPTGVRPQPTIATVSVDFKVPPRAHRECFVSYTGLLFSFFFFFFFYSSSSSAFPAISLGFTIFGEIFFGCDRFIDPTIEVVTFRLRGRCMLGAFLLPAFTRLGHEHQDLLSPCDGMHVRTDWKSVYTFIRKSLREWSQNPYQPQE